LIKIKSALLEVEVLDSQVHWFADPRPTAIEKVDDEAGVTRLPLALFPANTLPDARSFEIATGRRASDT
jgi:hypothetical protein